jgi:hypothetical protein|tara:strand:+ start:72 stop:290 length:219 start_codon:yes stop_codon:yes gene_type:complete
MGFNKLMLPDVAYLKESLKEKGNLEFGKFWHNRFMKSDAIMGPNESHEFLKQFVEHEYNVSREDSPGDEKSL